MNGVLVVDKPQGWTSHDVVNRVRRLAKTKRVGHLGTLDPMATGVLPLLIEKATRLSQYMMSAVKVYEGTVRFGFATDTYDAEGRPTSEPVAATLNVDEAERLFAPFRGEILQVPPPVSAKKIDGQPAYKLARKNQTVTLDAVKVNIHSLEILSVNGADVDLRIRCAAGTYIRSIAHDAGVALGCGAHLSRLRRTESGSFTLQHARTLEELGRLSEADQFETAIVPVIDLLPEFPTELVDSLTEVQIRQGRDFRVSPFRDRGDSRFVKAVSRGGELIAIGEIRMLHVYHPVVVL